MPVARFSICPFSKLIEKAIESSPRLIFSVRMPRTSLRIALSGAMKRDSTPSFDEISR